MTPQEQSCYDPREGERIEDVKDTGMILTAFLVALILAGFFWLAYEVAQLIF